MLFNLNVNGARGLQTHVNLHAFGVLVSIVELPHVEHSAKVAFASAIFKLNRQELCDEY
jgi:hypothetical protein